MARFCPSRGFILDLGGWGFAVPFYFVQDCSLIEASRYMTLLMLACAAQTYFWSSLLSLRKIFAALMSALTGFDCHITKAMLFFPEY